MKRISVKNIADNATIKQKNNNAFICTNPLQNMGKPVKHSHNSMKNIYILPSNFIMQDNQLRKRPTKRKIERIREQEIKKNRYSPNNNLRIEEMKRLAYGNAITPTTSNKRAFSNTILSIADRNIIRHKKRLSNIVPNIFLILCIILIVVCILILSIHMSDLSKTDDNFQQIAKTYTTQETGDDTKFPPSVDFVSLKSVNKEVSGWIYIPGTNVNYPILSSSEKEKYLRRDLWENRTVAGSIFTDWQNNADFSDKHIVLYGHHLPSNTMFTPVSNYLNDKDFYKQHKIIYIETPEYTYTLEVIGAYKVDPTETDEVNVNFPDDNTFQNFIDKKLERIKSDGVSSNDFNRKQIGKLFSLITCTDNGTARLMVSCIPIEKYPTSHVQGIRQKAGKRIITVSETKKDIKISNKPSKTKDKATNNTPWQKIIDWFDDIIYRLATEGTI